MSLSRYGGFIQRSRFLYSLSYTELFGITLPISFVIVSVDREYLFSFINDNYNVYTILLYVIYRTSILVGQRVERQNTS